MNPAELESAPGRDEIITEVRAIREALAAEEICQEVVDRGNRGRTLISVV